MADGSEKRKPRTIRKRLSANTWVLLLCVLIAAILWLLNALSRNHETEITLRVTYLNAPYGKVPVKPLPEELTFHVEAEGWQLLRLYFTAGPKVNVDISRLGPSDAFFPNAHIQYFNEQLSPEFSVRSVTPRMISLAFDVEKTVRLQVRLQDELTFAPSFEPVVPVILSPDSVDVTGPARVVDSLHFVSTEVLVVTDIRSSQSGALSLALSETSGLEVSPHIVSYRIEVTSYKDTSIEVSLHLKKAVNRGITISPEHVTVSFAIPVDSLQQLQDSAVIAQFEAVVDLTRIAGVAVEGVAPVTLESFPSFVRHPAVSPWTVSYKRDK